jgi:hypothetical protein
MIRISAHDTDRRSTPNGTAMDMFFLTGFALREVAVQTLLFFVLSL